MHSTTNLYKKLYTIQSSNISIHITLNTLCIHTTPNATSSYHYLQTKTYKYEINVLMEEKIKLYL